MVQRFMKFGMLKKEKVTHTVVQIPGGLKTRFYVICLIIIIE